MRKEIINRFFDNIKDLNCLVVGDLMIDAYRFGKVSRISPEAPVPVIEIDSKEDRLGGAANVAFNIKHLGATPILLGTVGKDEQGKLLKSLLEDNEMTSEGILEIDSKITTVKTRVIAQHQHLLRMDQEDCSDLSSQEQELLLEKFKDICSNRKIDVVIFEDYNKGLLNPSFIQNAISIASELNIPTTVDPKKANFQDFKGATLFKPNKKEIVEGLKLEDNSSLEDLKTITRDFAKKSEFDLVLLTLSEDGVMISDKSDTFSDRAHKRDIADVSGAGDTVIAVASLALAVNMEKDLIATLANLAGGLVCEKVGVVPIDKDQLHQEAIRLLIG